MRILIIEDDKDLAQLTKLALEKENFTVDMCLDGAEGLYYMQENMYDLVLLDRMLPSMDGTQVLKEARQSNISTPVIFLTALGELQDKVSGLNCGADDYMVKPFAFEELLARIHSIMRRPGKWGDLNLLKLGDIAFDPECGRLTKGAKECTLSGRESALLEVFLRNPGQVLPRNLLLSRVWGIESDVEEGNLDNYIHFLRRRLKSVESTGSQNHTRNRLSVGSLSVNIEFYFGNLITNVLPPPGVSRIRILPLCNITISLAIQSPSPKCCFSFLAGSAL